MNKPLVQAPPVQAPPVQAPPVQEQERTTERSGTSTGGSGCTQTASGPGGTTSGAPQTTVDPQSSHALVVGVVAAAVQNVSALDNVQNVLTNTLSGANVELVCLNDVLNENDIRLLQDFIVEQAQTAGKSVASVHLRHLNPLPPDLGHILREYRKVLVPEINSDHIALIESGQNQASALAVIDEAKRLIPNKPIRYVINTHSHIDHSGGLRAFVVGSSLPSGVVEPGDRVDVIATFGGPHPYTDTVGSGLQILSIVEQDAGTFQAGGATGPSLVLLVSPETAEQLASATAFGQLTVTIAPVDAV